MSADHSAWIVWDHHDGMDARSVGSGLDTRGRMAKAFKAGWELAGGDQRLAGVDRLQILVGDCPCHDKVGDTLCTTCTTLNDIRKRLGDDMDEPPSSPQELP